VSQRCRGARLVNVEVRHRGHHLLNLLGCPACLARYLSRGSGCGAVFVSAGDLHGHGGLVIEVKELEAADPTVERQGRLPRVAVADALVHQPMRLCIAQEQGVSLPPRKDTPESLRSAELTQVIAQVLQEHGFSVKVAWGTQFCVMDEAGELPLSWCVDEERTQGCSGLSKANGHLRFKVRVMGRVTTQRPEPRDGFDHQELARLVLKLAVDVRAGARLAAGMGKATATWRVAKDRLSALYPWAKMDVVDGHLVLHLHFVDVGEAERVLLAVKP